jgi:hypothetical protein
MFLKTIPVLLCLAFSPSVFAADNSIVGTWVFDSSDSIPPGCENITATYTGDGMEISRSGTLEMNWHYKLIPHNNGYLLRSKLVSDNGGVNCTGQDAAFVKAHLTPEDAYIEFIGNGNKIKMHPFGLDDPTNVILKRK